MQPTTYRTDDVDEANAIYKDVFYESGLEPARRSSQPFSFDMVADTAGPMAFAICNHGCEDAMRLGGQDMTYTVGQPSCRARS